MWSAIALAFGLAMDATAVSAARGLAATARPAEQRARELALLALLFGGFQSGMSALGWLGGRWAGPYLDRWDHWVAFGLLTAIGGKMLLDAWRHRRSDDAEREAPAATIAVYLGLAVATSIDAAAAGLTLPLVPVAPWISLVLIGSITAACSAAGYLAARFVGARFGTRVAALGGVVLIGIGVDLLVSSL